MNSEIEVKNLYKKIGRKNILEDLNFKVKKGDICGFLGPNGSGKTTAIRIITGLSHATKGDILIGGQNVKENREKALKNVGAIVESPILFSYMSGRKNLINLARLSNMKKQERENRVEEVLNIVGLSKRGDDKVKTYSLGMKQRLGIAQALLNNPEIIILDEPTNGLDPIGMKELRELILKLREEKGMTFLISSHLLDELQKICDSLVVIREGKLIWQGRIEEILKEEKDNLENVFMNFMG